MTQPIKRSHGAPTSPGVPTHAVLPAPGLPACDQLTRAGIPIADSGESYLAAGPSSQYLDTPISYSPPEALLTMPARSSPANGKATDCRTLTCTLGEIIAERSFLGSPRSNADAVLADIVDARGKFPEE
ncbi:MAG: hypothetical protein Q9204_006136 [Flavoplaca sp. TL-2023a]